MMSQLNIYNFISFGFFRYIYIIIIIIIIIVMIIIIYYIIYTHTHTTLPSHVLRVYEVRTDPVCYSVAMGACEKDWENGQVERS